MVQLQLQLQTWGIVVKTTLHYINDLQTYKATFTALLESVKLIYTQY